MLLSLHEFYPNPIWVFYERFTPSDTTADRIRLDDSFHAQTFEFFHCGFQILNTESQVVEVFAAHVGQIEWAVFLVIVEFKKLIRIRAPESNHRSFGRQCF